MNHWWAFETTNTIYFLGKSSSRKPKFILWKEKERDCGISEKRKGKNFWSPKGWLLSPHFPAKIIFNSPKSTFWTFFPCLKRQLFIVYRKFIQHKTMYEVFLQFFEIKFCDYGIKTGVCIHLEICLEAKLIWDLWTNSPSVKSIFCWTCKCADWFLNLKNFQSSPHFHFEKKTNFCRKNNKHFFSGKMQHKRTRRGNVYVMYAKMCLTQTE